jgi:RimJ/RimL family protein N-acetyltransferase
MQSFTTERLLIRPLAEQDKAMYISLYTDAKIMRNIGEPLTVEAAEKAFSRTIKAMRREKPRVITWTIVTLDNNKSIGLQALNWQSTDTADTAEIGIMLVTKANGQLYPEEAMGALMEYAFNYLSVAKINALYARKNLATKRFVKKLGFTYNATKQPENTDNSYQYFDASNWFKSLINQVI